MRAVFITGSGTEVGKTFVTSLLCRQLLAKGHRPGILKPVVSGYTDDEAAGSDPGRLLAALGEPVEAEAIARISPWRFTAPVAPDMAARREGRTLDYAAIVEFCRAEARTGHAGILLIEGVGGVMSPVTERRTVVDWIFDLAAPVILVGGTYLGSISHTLTSAECITRRGLQLLGIVLSESAESPVPIAETAEAVRRFSHDVPVIAVPRRPETGMGRPDLTYMLVE